MFLRLLLVLPFGVIVWIANAEGQPISTFQESSPYSANYDLATDAVMVYGMGKNFAERADEWKSRGYQVDAMTGISWGGYDDYYFTDGVWKSEEVQTDKSGHRFMHGDSKTVGYNVPTPAYIEYIKNKIAPAVDWGIGNLYLEEPEFWARTGWSEAFKREWKREYKEEWRAPDSSVDAQYKASQLKYRLYANALDEVFRFAKDRANSQGRELFCHVPTHSLINYAHWRIVSPESSLMQLGSVDGYIAQVWTGTARTPNMYRGKAAERTFETAYFEYMQMYAMVKPTGRALWFLHDPIEDNPDHTWEDYRKNYEATVVASLFVPDVQRFEVMPWPNRIFNGTYTRETPGGKVGERQGIPQDYATEILTVINALNDFKQDDIRWDAGTQGVGVVVSDTMMFQRADPMPSDPALGSFYGLAMPLLKNGIPAQVVQLECIHSAADLSPYKTLLLTYEGQKPPTPDFHNYLAEWVRQGGCLLILDDGKDPYNAVQSWWNDNGANETKACQALLKTLGVEENNGSSPVRLGRGMVSYWSQSPAKLTRDKIGADRLMEKLRKLIHANDQILKTQNHLSLRRGHYIIASVFEESLNDSPLNLEGELLNIFDPELKLHNGATLLPGERGVFIDLAYLRKHAPPAKVIAASARIRGENYNNNTLNFTAHGPENTACRIRILAPAQPKSITLTPEQPFTQSWDKESGTLMFETANTASTLSFSCIF